MLTDQILFQYHVSYRAKVSKVDNKTWFQRRDKTALWKPDSSRSLDSKGLKSLLALATLSLAYLVFKQIVSTHLWLGSLKLLYKCSQKAMFVHSVHLMPFWQFCFGDKTANNPICCISIICHSQKSCNMYLVECRHFFAFYLIIFISNF